MAVVDINVNYLKTNLDQAKKKFNDYKENISDLNVELKKVDTAWKDINTPYFLKQSNTDYNNFNKHISSMLKTVNYISGFLDNIIIILKNNINISQVSRFYLDSDGMNKVIVCLNNVNEYLNHNVSILANMTVPSEFMYKQQIKNILNNCTIIRNNMIVLNQKIYNINNNYLNLLSNYRKKTSQIENEKIDNNIMDYTYKVTDNLKILKDLPSLDNVKNANLVTPKKVDNLNINSNGMNIDKNFITNLHSNNSIDSIENKKININDSNLDSTTNNSNTILSPIETETIENSNDYNFVNSIINDFESEKTDKISVQQNNLYNSNAYNGELTVDNESIYNNNEKFNGINSKKNLSDTITNVVSNVEKSNIRNQINDSLSITENEIFISNNDLNNNSYNQNVLQDNISSVVINKSNSNTNDNIQKADITNSSIIFDNVIDNVNNESSNLNVTSTTTQV